jgi:hypothetical protein
VDVELAGARAIDRCESLDEINKLDELEELEEQRMRLDENRQL